MASQLAAQPQFETSFTVSAVNSASATNSREKTSVSVSRHTTKPTTSKPPKGKLAQLSNTTHDSTNLSDFALGPSSGKLLGQKDSNDSAENSISRGRKSNPESSGKNQQMLSRNGSFRNGLRSKNELSNQLRKRSNSLDRIRSNHESIRPTVLNRNLITSDADSEFGIDDVSQLNKILF